MEKESAYSKLKQRFSRKRRTLPMPPPLYALPHTSMENEDMSEIQSPLSSLPEYTESTDSKKDKLASKKKSRKSSFPSGSHISEENEDESEMQLSSPSLPKSTERTKSKHSRNRKKLASRKNARKPSFPSGLPQTSEVNANESEIQSSSPSLQKSIELKKNTRKFSFPFNLTYRSISKMNISEIKSSPKPTDTTESINTLEFSESTGDIELQFKKLFYFSIMALCNLLIFICGISVILINAYASRMGPNILSVFDNEKYFNIGYSLFIIVGILMILVSILRCVRIFLKRDWIYNLCSVIIGFTILFSLTAIVNAYVFKLDVAVYLHKNLLNNMKKYKNLNKNNVFTHAYDNLQRKLRCCGVVQNLDSVKTSGWESWKIQLSTTFNNKTQVPNSCCKNIRKNWKECQKKPNATNSYSNNDCLNSLLKWLWLYREHLGGMGIFTKTVFIFLYIISELVIAIL